MDHRGTIMFPSTVCCFATITVALMLFSHVMGKLVVAPENRVALLGESVQLDCSTDDKLSVGWQHISLGSTALKDVYISRTVVFPYNARFTVQGDELGANRTAYNLVVTDVRVEDAGTYRCVDRTGMGERRDAQLTVLGSLPKCTTNIGPNGFIGENDCGHPVDEIRISCSIEYTGNIVPEMKWLTTSGQDTIQSQPIKNVSEKTVSSEWSFKATTSMNEASVIWFSTQSTQTKWTSAPIKILYVKQNLTILSRSQGDIVTCNVNSSQNCSYTWTEVAEEFKPSEGQTLEVKKPGKYLCRALCPLHQRSCTVDGLRVEYSVTENGIDYMITFVIVTCVVIVVIVVIVLIALCITRWSKKKQNRAFDSTLSSKCGLLKSLANLLFPCSREISNGKSSSNVASSPSPGSDGTCLSKNLNSNGHCKSSTPMLV